MRRPEDQIKAMAAVGYELSMCARAARLCRDEKATGVGLAGLEGQASGLRQAILLEASLVHARCLIQLLTSASRRPDDITLTWFTDRRWEPSPGPSVTYLKIWYPRMHAHLAHLSEARVREGNWDWPVGEIARDVLELASSWHGHLVQEAPPMAELLEPYLVFATLDLTTWTTPGSAR
jgi:hypothetical protein